MKSINVKDFVNLFLCLIICQPSSSTSVLDVDGTPLQINTKYYILPTHPNNGGLALSIRDNRYPCPPNVLQQNDKNSNGLYLKIFPAETKIQEVSLSTDVNLVFMAATICVQQTVWKIGSVDPFTGHTYVRSDGKVGQPGAMTVRNWFKFEKYGEGYEIVYCPCVCSSCRVQCGDVVVFIENGRRWLGLGGDPFAIVFKKAD